jgi:hypothetical protein
MPAGQDDRISIFERKLFVANEAMKRKRRILCHFPFKQKYSATAEMILLLPRLLFGCATDVRVITCSQTLARHDLCQKGRARIAVSVPNSATSIQTEKTQ